MEGARLKYPCKSFPYKRYPHWVKYPCKGVKSEVNHSTPSLSENEGEQDFFEIEKNFKIEGKSPSSDLSDKTEIYPSLRRQCSFPYFRRCRPSCFLKDRHTNFISLRHQQYDNLWNNDYQDTDCTFPGEADYYDIICRIPFCKPVERPKVRTLAPFTASHCIFCDECLYHGGTICDLYEKVPALKKLSQERDDDVVHRIGIRTRVTVHLTCYEQYIIISRANSVHADLFLNGNNTNAADNDSSCS